MLTFRVCAAEYGPAIAGGLIQAGAVLIGILLAEALSRWKDRRDQLRRAVRSLFFTGHRLQIFLIDVPRDEIKNIARESDLSDHPLTLFIGTLNEVRDLSKWPIRHHKEIQKETERLAAGAAAIPMRKKAGQAVTDDEIYDAIGTSPLWRLVFRREDIRDDLYDRFIARGFG